MDSQRREQFDGDLEKYDWIKLRKDMDNLLPTETFKEKFYRKFFENPFVPIDQICSYSQFRNTVTDFHKAMKYKVTLILSVGCLATTLALSYGLWSFRMGRRKMSQYMMRTRIAAQGLTVLAMIVGVSMAAHKNAKTN